jgi:hypothetical protein
MKCLRGNLGLPLISFESVSCNARSFRPSSSDRANGFSVAKTEDLERSEPAKQPRRFPPDMVPVELMSDSGFRADPGRRIEQPSHELRPCQ